MVWYTYVMNLISFCLQAKKEAPVNEKPEPVKTHLRDMIIVPEMIGSIVGVYNGKTFNQVEIKVNIIAFKFSNQGNLLCHDSKNSLNQRNVFEFVYSLKWWDIIWESSA